MAIRATSGENVHSCFSSFQENPITPSQQRVSESVSSLFPNIQSRELPAGRNEASEMAEQAFFDSLELAENDSLRKPEIYLCFRKLFNKYKLGSHYCVIDLFNIYFSERLHYFQQLLPKDMQTFLFTEWGTNFIRFSLSLMRSQEQTRDFPEITETFFGLLSDHLSELQTLSENILSSIMPEGAMNKNARKRRMVALEIMKNEWRDVLKIFTKISKHPQGANLFLSYPLDLLPGSAATHPTSRQELPQILETLEAYIHTFLLGIEYLEQTKKIVQANPKAIEYCLQKIQELKNSPQQDIEFLQNTIHELISHCSELIIHYNNLEAEYVKRWTFTDPGGLEQLRSIIFDIRIQSFFYIDCKSFCEKILLPLMNPDFISSAAYTNRFKEMATQAKNWVSSLTSPLPQIYNKQFEIIFDIAQLIACVDHYSAGRINHATIRANHKFLTESITTLLDALSKNSRFQDPSDTKIEALCLAKLFVFSYDLNVILGNIHTTEASDLDIFPDQLIELLVEKKEEVFEQEIADDDIEAKNIFSEHQEEAFFKQDEIEAPNFEDQLCLEEQIAQEPAPLQEISSKAEAAYSAVLDPHHREKITRKPKEIHQVGIKPKRSSSPVEKPSSSQIDPRELLHVRKRKEVEEILKALGLQRGRQRGSHVMWEHPAHPERHATVPQRLELPPGTVRSIFKQATGNQTGF